MIIVGRFGYVIRDNVALILIEIEFDSVFLLEQWNYIGQVFRDFDFVFGWQFR